MKVYGLPTCAYCKLLKDFLKEHNVDFEYIDCFKSDCSECKEINESNDKVFPYIIEGNKKISGFNLKQIMELIK
jgi:glutaredoxin